MPIMGLLDRSGSALAAELGAARGLINPGFYRHLGACGRHRQSAVFIRGISRPEEIAAVFYRQSQGGRSPHEVKGGFLYLFAALCVCWLGFGAELLAGTNPRCSPLYPKTRRDRPPRPLHHLVPVRAVGQCEMEAGIESENE